MVIMPIYYDLEIPIYPAKRNIVTEEDLTTFRPSKGRRGSLMTERDEPLHPK